MRAGLLFLVVLFVGPVVVWAQGQYDPAPAPVGQQTQAIEGQLRTAIQHAKELGATSSALGGIQMHLQHTVNCLEGSSGKNFNAQVGNPCQGQGNGFLNDAKDKAGAVFLARQADQLAIDTVKTVKDVPTAQAAARSVAAILEETMKLIK